MASVVDQVSRNGRNSGELVRHFARSAISHPRSIRKSGDVDAPCVNREPTRDVGDHGTQERDVIHLVEVRPPAALAGVPVGAEPEYLAAPVRVGHKEVS